MLGELKKKTPYYSRKEIKTYFASCNMFFFDFVVLKRKKLYKCINFLNQYFAHHQNICMCVLVFFLTLFLLSINIKTIKFFVVVVVVKFN